MLRCLDAVIARAERISRGLAWAAGALLLMMVALIVTEILMRRLLGRGLGLSFEYSGYVLGISASWSFAYALFHKAHIRIDAAYVRLGSRGRQAFDLLAMGCLAAFAVFAAQAAWGVLDESLMRGSVSNTPLRTPMWIPQAMWVGGWIWFAFTVALLMLRIVIAALAGDAETFRRLAGGSTIDEQIAEEAPDAKGLGS